MDLAVVPASHRTPFRNHTYSTLAREGYKSNSAVYACIKELAKRAKEPPIYAYNSDNKRVIDHPMEKLLRRPNPWMNDRRLMVICTIYAAISGNAYLYKQRNNSREVVALYPYNDAQIQPVPTPDFWISHYRYDIGDGHPLIIPVEDIIHLTWDNVDPEAPWKGFGPLLALAREVDTDTELTKMVYAFLRNDATPRTLLHFKPVPADAPKGTEVAAPSKKPQKGKAKKDKENFQQKFGGDNRGGIMVVRGGDVSLHRISVGLKEIEAGMHYEHSETRVPTAFGMDPMLIGFAAGIKSSTYSNKEEARLGFVEDTLVPHWQNWGDILTMALEPDFNHHEPVQLAFDLKQVTALQWKMMKFEAHASKMYNEGVLMLNETRARMGEPRVDGGDRFAPRKTTSISLDEQDQEVEEDEPSKPAKDSKGNKDKSRKQDQEDSDDED